MNLLRLLLLGLISFMARPVSADVHTYFVHDHQIRNYLTQKCHLDIEGEWLKVIRTAQIKNNHFSFSTKALKVFKQKLKDLIPTNPHQNIELNENTIEALISKKMPDRVAQILNNLQECAAIQNHIVQLEQKVQSSNNWQSRLNFNYEFNAESFTHVELSELILDAFQRFFNKELVQSTHESFDLDDDNDDLDVRPFGLIRLQHDDENNQLAVTLFPNFSDSGEEALSYHTVLYEPFQASHWKRNVTIGLLGMTAVAGAYGIYNNWGNWAQAARDVKDAIWDPNECGNDFAAGPGCVRPWEIRCQGDYCGPKELGPNDEPWIIAGDCSYKEGCNTITLAGGRDFRGHAYCQVDMQNQHQLAYIGQLAPGEWRCPVGKSPFHFLKDGRLCFYKTPVIRAYTHDPVCDTTAPYCKLSDGLTLYRHGEDMLLTPPCGQGVKICRVADLKLYLHKDGKYREASPCDPVESGGLCVFDENTIEFWNDQTQQWQDKPVDYNQDQIMYRFKTDSEENEVKVFCKKDGSCTIKFPCELNQGVCPVDTTKFYTQKGSGKWTEGMPCILDDQYCMLENNQVFYPHLDGDVVTWKEVPAWIDGSITGFYTGPDGKQFIPNDACDAWMPIADGGQCFIKDGSLAYCDQNGVVRYWHTNGSCGWNNAPMCSGSERDGICVGPDGRVFILNDDLSQWIPEPASCKHETALFCVNQEDGSVKYWHRGVEDGQTGFWHDVPDCKDFAGKDYCVGPDKSLFGLNEETRGFTRITPVDPSKSELYVFKNDYAVWDPAQQVWLVNDAPCDKKITYEGRFSNSESDRKCCLLDDGNTLYQHVDGQGNGTWQLSPQVAQGVNVYVCDDQTKRWRQIPNDAQQWKEVMPCPDSDKKYVVPYNVYNDAVKKQQDGRAKMIVETDVCENVSINNLQAHCIDCKTHDE